MMYRHPALYVDVAWHISCHLIEIPGLALVAPLRCLHSTLFFAAEHP
jgi:hypothetical protein